MYFVRVKPFKLYFLFLLFGCCNAQSVMEIITEKNKYEVYVNDVIEYKLKGQHHYRKDVIVNMNDTCVLLDKDSIVKIADIKALRLHRGEHLLGTINGACFIAGVGYVTLNVINNLILESSLKVDPKAIYVSAAFIVAGVILKIIGTKHVRIRSNTAVRVVNRSYQNISK
jgi:hypothetical protein